MFKQKKLKEKMKKTGSVEKYCLSVNSVKTCTMLIFVIFLLSIVSAQLEFFQKDYQFDNYTLISTLLYYDASISNFVTGENPLEVYAWYDVYVESWNELNPDYPVEKCNLTIKQFPKTSSEATFFYEKNFTGDYRDAKYFLRMNDGDTAFFNMACYFSSENTSIIIPANVQIVTPTTECKECQYYEWTLLERDIVKAEEIGDKRVNVTGFIYQVFYLNYQILLALFWIILILIAIHSTALIFLGVVWLFAYLKNLIT